MGPVKTNIYIQNEGIVVITESVKYVLTIYFSCVQYICCNYCYLGLKKKLQTFKAKSQFVIQWEKFGFDKKLILFYKRSVVITEYVQKGRIIY